MTYEELFKWQKTHDWTEEGFVLRYSDNFRVKVKSEDYLRVSALKANLSEKHIWEIIKNNHNNYKEVMINIMKDTPDEFQKEYLVWNVPKPTNQKQIDFCNSLANTTEIEPNRALLSAFQANYSTTGQSEEKQLSKASEMAKTYEAAEQASEEESAKLMNEVVG